MLFDACGGYVFRAYRVTPGAENRAWLAEAKRADQPFCAQHALAEPLDHDVWFEFGRTSDEALRKLKAELLH